MFVCVWLCMTMYDFVWLYMTVYDYVLQLHEQNRINLNFNYQISIFTLLLKYEDFLFLFTNCVHRTYHHNHTGARFQLLYHTLRQISIVGCQKMSPPWSSSLGWACYGSKVDHNGHFHMLHQYGKYYHLDLWRDKKTVSHNLPILLCFVFEVINEIYMEYFSSRSFAVPISISSPAYSTINSPLEKSLKAF